MKGKIFSTKLFTVLLADDDTDDQLIFQQALNELEPDIDLHMVKNGEEALLLLEVLDPLPEILFLDLNMPKMNGLTCLKEIKKNARYDDLCIAIYSTSSNQGEIEETLSLGAHVYINKPNDFGQLKDILLKVITFNGICTEPYLKRDFFMMNLGAEVKTSSGIMPY